MSTLLKKIIDRDIPADIVYEDERALAFRDINPQAPPHVLIIPRRHIATINDLDELGAAERRHELGVHRPFEMKHTVSQFHSTDSAGEMPPRNRSSMILGVWGR